MRQFLLQLWNTYGFYVLYANVNDVAAPRRARRPSSTAGRSRACNATIAEVRERHGGLRRDARRPGDRRVRRRALELVRAPLAPALLGRRPGRLRDAAARCLVDVAQLLAPFCPFVADAIYENLDGVRAERAPDATSRRPGERDVELEGAMGVARETVRLGLAARGHGKLKVRQPLRAAVVVAAGDERAAIERLARRSCCEELNVKELRFVREADELGSYEVKPNYRTLGPRFGKQMPQVAAAVAALDPAHVAAALRDGGRVGDQRRRPRPRARRGRPQLAMQPLEGYQLEREGSHAVALELELDEELRREGLAREIVHAVQNARKAAGLAGRGPDRARARRRRGAARRRARARGLRRGRDARDVSVAYDGAAGAGGEHRGPPPAGVGDARLQPARPGHSASQSAKSSKRAAPSRASSPTRAACAPGSMLSRSVDIAVRRRVERVDQRHGLPGLGRAAAEPQQRRLARGRCARSASACAA